MGHKVHFVGESTYREIRKMCPNVSNSIHTSQQNIYQMCLNVCRCVPNVSKFQGHFLVIIWQHTESKGCGTH